MAERELRRLKRRDLLEMLLVQCEETERLQKETDEMKRQLADILESYERLKIKLNIKDERLNQKDAKITDLKHEIEEMRTSRIIELEEAGSIAEAALRINGVFEAAQRAAEQYLMNVKMMSEKEISRESAGNAAQTSDRVQNIQIPFEYRKTNGSRKRMKEPRIRQFVPMKTIREDGDIDEGQIHEVIAAVSGDIHGS